MKRCFAILLIVISLFSFFGCNAVTSNEITLSIGEHTSTDITVSDALPEKTVFSIYTYEEYSFENNIYFKKIDSESKEIFKNCINAFERRLSAIYDEDATSDFTTRYTFDKSIISDDDYLYIESESKSYSEQSVYFFDTSSATLYYFNIVL